MKNKFCSKLQFCEKELLNIDMNSGCRLCLRQLLQTRLLPFASVDALEAITFLLKHHHHQQKLQQTDQMQSVKIRNRNSVKISVNKHGFILIFDLH